ncbi:MAG: DUF2723 domain-containing protein [Candidatus Zixiibacteriota bacterium]|nr:MAG: DUF2723 domain-containing protein [candidate division Zixibacteria bacterium]
MTGTIFGENARFDRSNVILAGLVFLFSFIVYALTVQRSLPFWDCGEFIAAAYIMGVPHPPGFPGFMLLGRLISIIPFVEDISYRVNYLSVISSAFTAMFSYLVIVRVVSGFFQEADRKLGRVIAYIGGLAGAGFVAFSATNWANSVEAETYGLALALSVAIFWLALVYHEQRGTYRANRIMVLALYLAVIGIGIHMTVYLVVPVCAVFFILKDDAKPRDYVLICIFAILELLMVIIFGGGRGGPGIFKFMTVLLGIGLFAAISRRVKWGILVAVASISTIMMSFSLYLKVATPIGFIDEAVNFMNNRADFLDLMKSVPYGLLALIALGYLSKKKGWRVQWKTGLAIVAAGFIGFSMHYTLMVRSFHNPRIDENNISRDHRTFVNFLDRKQYGQVNMIDRMFTRRGEWENQFGRHPHMGFWSYFEEQYSRGRWTFTPFLLLGLLGMIVAIYKRQEIGMPFFTLFLLASLGLVLYMNFADGTHYNAQTNEAYLEVRNRDYFFTPAFVFFGIAMGLGVSAAIMLLKEWLARNNPGLQKTIVYACSVLVLLPGISLSKNYHACDRSGNFIPYSYSKNILDSCPPNAILFTAGDNDTFPVWCLQEVYNYRRDVRVVNLSLLNTDWYVEQMKNRYDVPISLSDSQIVWHPVEVQPGVEINRPLKPFYDKPRRRQTYLNPSPWGGRVVKVQDMMVDEIVLENRWRVPICFNAQPYAESPLNLRDRAVLHGLVYYLDRDPEAPEVDAEHGYDLFMNTYDFTGFTNSDVYRDENATGVFFAVGVNASRIASELIATGDTTRAVALLEKMIDVYPEYWQTYLTLIDMADRRGDSTLAAEYYWTLHDTLQAFKASNQENLFYKQDLGLIKFEIGRREGDAALSDEGLRMMWDAFDENRNSSYAFRKLITTLYQLGRRSDMMEITRQHAEYKVNMNDPMMQQLMRQGAPRIPPQPTPAAPPPLPSGR